MAGRSPLRFFWLLLFLIPALFLYFGIDSAVYRITERAEAEPMVATVEDYRTEQRCDDDGCSTVVAYDLILDIKGDIVKRPLIEGNFDPEDIWHSEDMIPPSSYPAGSEMPVLVRADLGYLVTIDAFWSAYVLPIVLCGFGMFWLLGFAIIVPQLTRDS